jgi:hypothetical protein
MTQIEPKRLERGQSLPPDVKEHIQQIIYRTFSDASVTLTALQEVVNKETGWLISRQSLSKMVREASEDITSELRRTAIWEVKRVAQQYQYVISEAVEAWESSKQYRKVVKRFKEGEDADGVVDNVVNYTITEMTGAGQHKYLEVAIAAIEGYKALLGLNAPERIEYQNVTDTNDAAGESDVKHLAERMTYMMELAAKRQAEQEGYAYELGDE